MSLANHRMWRHPGAALILPLALLALGGWQLTRVVGQTEGFETRVARMDAAIERIQPLVTRTPSAVVRFNGNPQDFTATEALARMQEARTDLRRDAMIDTARTGAAWATIGGGAVSLIAALLCVLFTAIGARQGRRSREALVSSFARVVRMLPPLLGSVAVATSIGVVGAVLFEVGGAWFLESWNTGEVKLILAGLAVAAASLIFAVTSVRQLMRALGAFTPRPMEVLGREATPAEAPGLWAFLGDIAARQGAAVPDHVVLGLTDGFFVTSSQVRIAPENRVLSGRTLYLTASVLPLLEPAQITSIIAHELAHFTGEDTQYSQHFAPLFASMVRSMEAVTARSTNGGSMNGVFQPAGVLAGHVLESFQHVVSHWSRLREFEADQASLRAADGRAAATALLRSSMASNVASTMLREVYGRPSRASDDFVGEVMARAGAVGLVQPESYLEDRQPHPTDSHPPARQRIEAFGVTIDDALLAEASHPLQEADTAFVSALFTDWVGLRRQLGTDLLGIAREHDRQYVASLEQAAHAVVDDVEVHERGMAQSLGLGIPGLVLFGIGLFVGWIALRSTYIEQRDMLIVGSTGLVLLAVGAAFMLFGAQRYRRVKEGPFLILGPHGFQCVGIEGEIPWSSVSGVQVITGQAFVTVFGFLEGKLPRVQTGRQWSVKLDRKRNTLRLKGYVPRGMKPQAYLDLLNRAWRAWRAQELLRAREAEEQAA